MALTLRIFVTEIIYNDIHPEESDDNFYASTSLFV